MKAIVITMSGGPEVLQLQEVEGPQIKDDEVLIKIEAIAINRGDTLQRKGLYPPPKGTSPYPGLECSGVVEQVGQSDSRWKVGDQASRWVNNIDQEPWFGSASRMSVMTSEIQLLFKEDMLRKLLGGGYAEKVAVPEAQVLPVPSCVSLKDAASFP
ncbi:hypothetical protein Ancab_033764 [Ancistrocladus abbreviatus]